MGAAIHSTADVETRPYRIYVIEPVLLLAKMLCNFLDQDPEISVLGDARTIEDANVGADEPDLIFIDCDADLSRMQTVISNCRDALPNARICVLSAQLNTEVMERALAVGADGYAVKDSTPEQIRFCVKQIQNDGFYTDVRLSRMALRGRVRSAVRLSARETDVAWLIAQGLSNREIGERLVLSDKTVKNHVSNIFSKLHVTARTQVAIYALRNGL